ncbi:hypothetical protein AGMMS50268_21530 [Spirochaetia bacterium]|nr:hypothetical protein AGMMS50268_21530 [Spirochaetia bacterium]
MKLPSKCIIDANVPIVANLIKHPDPSSDIDLNLTLECIKAVEHVKEKNALVLDSEDIIFNQYRDNLSKTAGESFGDLGSGDAFYLWVRDNRFSFSEQDRVVVTKTDDSYDEFPKTDTLKGFDPADKIFIAVSNKHKKKPPILQGTDSKWWGYKDQLEALGIKVIFLCPEYVKKIYERKME